MKCILITTKKKLTEAFENVKWDFYLKKKFDVDVLTYLTVYFIGLGVQH